MRHLLLAFLLACAFQAQAENTASGHSYTPLDSFAVSAAGPLLRLTAPEGAASIVVVDLASATDADDAVTQAWKLAQPEFRRILRLATPRASRNGWADQKVFDYETWPNEKLVLQAA